MDMIQNMIEPIKTAISAVENAKKSYEEPWDNILFKEVPIVSDALKKLKDLLQQIDNLVSKLWQAVQR